jgi:hypothetical protein
VKRLEALERAAKPGGYDTVHQLVIEQGDNADARIAALCASGEAKESDLFIVRMIVAPAACVES